MRELFMLAGGIVEPGAGQPGAVSAYVAYNPRAGTSRLFKVHGPVNAPSIDELDPATTVDLNRFRLEVQTDVTPALEDITARGGAAAIATPSKRWVTELVQRHLGLD